MATESFLIFSLTLIALLPLLSDQVFAHSHTQKPSPFEFLKHLQGCHKGEKVKGIHELKQYLEQFGYLSYGNQSQVDNDDFDDLLESAIKTYQRNYHLNATGSLDAKTILTMIKPRCAVADIINGTTWMRSGKAKHQHGSSPFHTVSHFSFFPGNPKWPATKYHLTYGFVPGTREDAIGPVARAFSTWAANTHFRFTTTENYRNADIKISFGSGDHGDGNPFDGAGGVIAHAYAPQDGPFHFDADETWAAVATPGAFGMETVALHEIGHLLGLMHSSVEGAIMYPTIAAGVSKRLHGDDIQGIKSLYNVG